MKIKSIIGILCLSLCLLIAPAAAAGGDGTSANPYQIETAAELQSIQNDLSAHYILMNDIDLTGVTWAPIGSTSASFFGELDGNGYTISNLNLSTTIQSAGIFSSLTSGATIIDLTLEDCHVKSTSSRCGTLIGSIIMSSSEHEPATLQNIELVRCSAITSQSISSNMISAIQTYSVVNIFDCTISECIAESTSSGYSANIVSSIASDSTVQILNTIVEYSHSKANIYDVSNIVGVCSDSSLIIENSEVISCISESVNGNYVANVLALCTDAGSVSIKNTIVSNCIAKSLSGYQVAGFIASSLNSGSSIAASNCTIKESTIIANYYAGGIAGRVQSGTTGVFTDCEITACSILANTYAAGVCPSYS